MSRISKARYLAATIAAAASLSVTPHSYALDAPAHHEERQRPPADDRRQVRVETIVTRAGDAMSTTTRVVTEDVHAPVAALHRAGELDDVQALDGRHFAALWSRTTAQAKRLTSSYEVSGTGGGAEREMTDSEAEDHSTLNRACRSMGMINSAHVIGALCYGEGGRDLDRVRDGLDLAHPDLQDARDAQRNG